MTYLEAEQYIEALKPGGMKLGLERMERILSLLGNPQQRLRVVHVAGTNGKGSTAAMVQSIVTAAGYRVGLYTSPAVTGLRDTITIDGVPVSQAEFARLVEKIAFHAADMGEVGGLSEFELVTVLALLHFAGQHVDICVLECGLGGRDDATNCIPPPLVAVFTPISLDHTALLGQTVEEIAAVKSGIIKAPCSIVSSPGQSPEALAVIMEQAAGKGLSVHIPNRAAARILSEEWGKQVFCYGEDAYILSMNGAFQVDNALTAMEVIHCLREKGFAIEQEAVRKGLEASRLPCRQEVVHRRPLVLLDGSHNPDGVRGFATSLERLLPSKEGTLLIGMLRDKDTACCVRMLAPFFAHVVCTAPASPRALEPGLLARQMENVCMDVTIEPEPVKALAMARQKAGENPLIVAGSFFLSGDLRPYLL